MCSLKRSPGTFDSKPGQQPRRGPGLWAFAGPHWLHDFASYLHSAEAQSHRGAGENRMAPCLGRISSPWNTLTYKGLGAIYLRAWGVVAFPGSSTSVLCVFLQDT